MAKQQSLSDTPPSYNAAELQGYARQGKAQSVGRLVVNTKLFGPAIYANAKILLIPLTDYTVWYVHVRGDALANGDDRRIDLSRGLTDYENETDRVETRTVYTMSDDDLPSRVTTQHIKTNLRRELDFVAAQGTFTRADERLEVQALPSLELGRVVAVKFEFFY